MIKIIVSSQNPNKIKAAQELFAEYSRFHPFIISSKSVKSNVNHQPMFLDETVEGAINRASNGYLDCSYSIGVEGVLCKYTANIF